MRAEVIAIGDELITGQRLDTNSQWLSQRLLECGIAVAYHSTVGDLLPDNIAVFQTAIARADVVVCTGGLGPTADDLTRQAIADALEVPLVRNAASLAHIQQLFTSRGREMPERNQVQADFPADSQPIPNQHGTAPGIAIKIPRSGYRDGPREGPHQANRNCLLFALPGVPAELKPMWHETIAPALLAAQDQPRITVHRRLKCFGVGESQLEAMLPDLFARGREPTVGITVSNATITLRVTNSGPDEAACVAAMQPTFDTIHEKLQTLVYGSEDDELEHVVLRLLAEKQQTLAVAEWATGGLVSESLGAADDGQYFLSGITLRSTQQANLLLGTQLAETNTDSPEVALALAEAVRQRSQADYGLGIAAMPDAHAGEDAKLNDAKLCIAIATPDRTHKLRFPCRSHPAIVRSRTAKQAMNALRLILLGAETEREH